MRMRKHLSRNVHFTQHPLHHLCQDDTNITSTIRGGWRKRAADTHITGGWADPVVVDDDDVDDDDGGVGNSLYCRSTTPSSRCDDDDDDADDDDIDDDAVDAAATADAVAPARPR